MAHRFNWKWYLGELKQDKPVTVFSTFSCGGGSTMGYKRAGFKVLGNVEIDPKINEMYVANNHPKYNYCMDLRDFNKKDDLPDELFHLDILDGSPPCSTFSSAGKREQGWGVEKAFREGQKKQRLDDLFFTYLDTVEKLRPKICIAENVTGILAGKAKGYVNEIVKRFKELGYDLQVFRLNSCYMDVPQSRERVFFIANDRKYGKLKLDFNYDPILYGEVKTGVGRPAPAGVKNLSQFVLPGERKMVAASGRVYGKLSYYSYQMQYDEATCATICSAGSYIRMPDLTMLTDEDFVNCQSFPQDYNFCGNPVQYVCGMSVPPNMMANIATEIWEQWLKDNVQIEQ